jgi:hypothetical protein
MPLQATSGAASYDAFGGGVPVVPNYIEEVFSTWLYRGNADTQVITNGIDLSTKGGLVWAKARPRAGDNHEWRDTVRGGNSRIFSNNTNAASSTPNPYTYNTDGYTIGGDGGNTNENNITYASWTFRKQPKFFDVVTWTGNSTAGRQITHNLGSVPGCIIVKCTSTSGDNWCVFHRSLGRSSAIFLNLTSASGSSALWDGTDPTSTNFTVSSNGSVNGSGETYVAYLFAHDAGGFGLTGTDNVISCGSFTGGANVFVNLGYEPQWLLTKVTNEAGGGWDMLDNMRGWDMSGSDKFLQANTNGAEITFSGGNPTATGFNYSGNTGNTIIYIAIRRGPMKVPTDATKVFSPVARTGTGSATTLTSAGFPPDLYISQERTLSSYFGANWFDRLRGRLQDIFSSGTGAESTVANTVTGFDAMQGVILGTDGADSGVNRSGIAYANWNFRRAPGFFDEVCYTGGVSSNPSHNLGVTPEMYIVKCRSSGTSDRGWYVYHTGYDTANNYILMNSSAGRASLSGVWASGPTSTTFGVANGYAVNDSGQTYVAYLFATCAGVSKVGSYTGTGTTQTINCGFTAGARFVLIKRTDSTGDWYVWDSARGIVAGNDPYLWINSYLAEVTGTDYVDTASTGFEISSTAPAAINANGGTFIFLAIA